MVLMRFCLLMMFLTSLAACSIGGTLAALTPGSTGEVVFDQRFGEHPRDQADVYKPLATTKPPASDSASLRPLLVFIYGGSWRSGSRGTYQFVGKALADLGYVTVIPDYRVYPEVQFPGFIEDNARAVAWAAKNAEQWGADPNRIVLVSHSAGAYNAAMLLTDPGYLADVGIPVEQIVGFVGLAGPYDFYPILNERVMPVFNHPNYPSRSQPIRLVHDNLPPSFIGSASEDDLVEPQRNATQFARLLEEQGVPVTLKLYDRVGHMTLIGSFAGPLQWLAPVLDDVETFLNQL